MNHGKKTKVFGFVREAAAIYINFDINEKQVENMANEKKKSKGPQDRNSNYQMKNGNSLSKKKDKKSNAGKSGETKSVVCGKVWRAEELNLRHIQQHFQCHQQHNKNVQTLIDVQL